MEYGVTKNGFVRMRLPEIRQAIVKNFVGRLRKAGFAGNIETRPDSLTGLLVDTFADREAALWELAEGVYFAMYPPTAAGLSLDHAIAFSGARRLADVPNRCYVVAYGVPGTAIRAGAQIRHRVTQMMWQTTRDVTVSVDATADVAFSVGLMQSGADYTVTLDGAPYSYHARMDDTPASVVRGLAHALLPCGFNVESHEQTVRVVSDGRRAFAVAVSANLDYARVGSPVLAESVDCEAQLTRIGDLAEMVTQVPGWTEVANLQPGAVGHLAENDAEVRVSYRRGIYRLGAATLPALQSNLKERIAGALAVRVYQNDDDLPDAFGRPPHSIHVVIDGGVEDDIGEQIFRTVAGGIDTHGDRMVVVTDNDGVPQRIRFDRSHRLYTWVRVRVRTQDPEEERFPGDGYNTVKKGIVAIANELGIGEDVVVQRLYAGVFQTAGVARAEIRLAHSADPAYVPAEDDYRDANIVVNPFERARFDVSRVEVQAWT